MKYTQLSKEVQNYLLDEYKDMIENEAERRNISEYQDPTEVIIEYLNNIDNFVMIGSMPESDSEYNYSICFDDHKVVLQKL